MRLGCVNLRPGRDGRSGLTLLEVIIALSVFMVGSVGICTLITQSRRLSDSARDHYVAVNLAKNRMERARNMDVSVLPLIAESSNYLDVGGSPVPQADAMFMRSTSVRCPPTNMPNASNLTEVVVTIDIRDRGSWKFAGIQEVVRTYFTRVEAP